MKKTVGLVGETTGFLSKGGIIIKLGNGSSLETRYVCMNQALSQSSPYSFQEQTVEHDLCKI